MRQFIDLLSLKENAEPEHQRFWYDPKKDELYSFYSGHHVHHALENSILKNALNSVLTPAQQRELLDQAEAAVSMHEITRLHNRVMNILGDLGYMRGGYDPMTFELYIEYKGNDAARQYRNARKLMRHFHDVRLLTVEVYSEGAPEYVLLQDPDAIERFRKFGSTRKKLGESDVSYDHTDEHFKPRPMTEKKVLYRSVSLPELAHIWGVGYIMGGANNFNAYDPRRNAFFGDTLNDHLLWQGEEVDRQASYAMSTEPVYREYTLAKNDLEEAREIFMEVTQVALMKYRHEPEAAKFIEEIDNGNIQAAYKAKWFLKGPDLVAFNQSMAKLSKLHDELSELQTECRDLIREKQADIEMKRSLYPITSAVIVTKPIRGGLHYSKAWGKSGMGENDEYGFRSAQVKFNDIASILLVKDMKVIGKLDPLKLGDYLAKIKYTED